MTLLNSARYVVYTLNSARYVVYTLLSAQCVAVVLALPAGWLSRFGICTVKLTLRSRFDSTCMIGLDCYSAQ